MKSLSPQQKNKASFCGKVFNRQEQSLGCRRLIAKCLKVRQHHSTLCLTFTKARAQLPWSHLGEQIQLLEVNVLPENLEDPSIVRLQNYVQLLVFHGVSVAFSIKKLKLASNFGVQGSISKQLKPSPWSTERTLNL